MVRFRFMLLRTHDYRTNEKIKGKLNLCNLWNKRFNKSDCNLLYTRLVYHLIIEDRLNALMFDII